MEVTHIVPGATVRTLPVCYTALFGNYEELKEPLVITPGWRYIVYTDQDLTSSVWEIVKVKIPEGVPPQYYARWYKIMHWVDWGRSIWVDASFVIAINLEDWWTSHSMAPFSAAKHPLRDDWFEECMDCIISGRGDRVEVDKQMNEYKALELPRHAGVIQSGILLRENTPDVIALCEAWWKEMQGRSIRDQIAFCRVGIGSPIVHTYLWDYRIGKDFIYKHHYNRR